MVENEDIEIILENEWYSVRHSGELPEVALHAAFFYLSENQDGPRLKLTEDQARQLVDAAALRYREIVLRDILYSNRGQPVYRGVKRSIANWYRYESFCQRQQIDPVDLRTEVAAALVVFLNEAIRDGACHGGPASLDCSWAELRGFVDRLGLSITIFPAALRTLCKQ